MTKQTIKAQADGRNGQIDFEIDLENNKISDVKVTKNSETPAIFNQAFGKLKKNIIDNQSFDVDAVSGASLMTQAMLDSGKKALAENNIALDGKKPEVVHEERQLNVDVAVIGSGMAGLMAASRALSMGKKVVVLEKNGYLGGATILNGSNVVGTGSKVSAELFGETAKKDSPTRLVQDITRECRGTNYPMLSKLLANNIGKAVDFITEFANLTYQRAETQTVEHSVNRQIEMPSESSYELVTKVAEAFEKKGGQIILDARVEKLNKDKASKLVSLTAEGKHQTINVNFKSLVLAAGGWGARDYQAHKTDIPYYGPMTSTGDYFDFAKNMNLVTRNLDWYKVYPHGLEVEPGIAKLTTYSTKEATDMGAIFVNTDGKRIVNESAPYTHFRDAIAEQKGKVAYIVMDQRTWDRFYELMLKYGFTKEEVQSFFDLAGEKSPVLVKGDLKTVAEKAGIDYQTLKETVDNYTEDVKADYDPEFGRDKKFMHEFEGDTYYVIEQKLRFCTTLGGYETTDQMQLLDNDMNPVSNFYAAGEIVGGANGHDSMPSMMNSWSYASGFVAGTTAADNTNYNYSTVSNEQEADAVSGASEA
ncbi:FAD-dependent oxidoreductase [Lactobacillus crispatus]|uniref:Urocanate reductase n=1 Tax=Lactobacillus crispatus TaxID=47770 RepID=A0AAW8WJL9_9LACO|nr:FAD-dependent oxidoreductase [Lactobacillus crispatus]MBI1703357.1 fumarate reductase [Lactobacillus crispatus]MDK6664458.1 FAD-dependent oxidoreductase [Lactobacillus crispatus]MDK8611401.1 FAD-dependent oxidoreductase [Lactobacillus crispatus]MDT9608553.1 FAD-dependent oxidoreductase [Lactobacillus crispatus]MDT9616212.1 FAD-dependent oxidoreductase [Lactobacillus crispatus]